ncbi:486_t:CDS:2, partial [Entrophospora sp. SA101]
HTGYDSNHQVHILSTCDETGIRQFPHEDYLKQAKSRLETWVKVNESVLNNTNYKRVLTNSINNNFPKKEQLLKAKHDWVAVHVSVRIPIIKTSERSERILSDAKSKEHSRIQKTTCQVRFEENMSHEDTTSEESDDITLVEFNSYEIKNKISNVKLDPQDLLPNGIINHTFLQNYHKRLFDLIVKQNCLNELLWSRVELHRYKMKLAIEEKNFICSHIKYGNCTAPNG